MGQILLILLKMYKITKIASDYIFSILTFILLVPFYLLLGALVYLSFGKPIIFKQVRSGKNCTPFTIYKFRTMTNQKDSHGNLESDEKRLTSFGFFLRRTSLDELPSILNVIKGDMSFVGPRPLLSIYEKKYSKEQLRRHNAKPGITGLAQVSGRNSISWKKKFELDVYYVDNISLSLDLKILFLTIWIVLRGQDIKFKNEVSSSIFLGNENEKE